MRNPSISVAPIPAGTTPTMITRYFDHARVLRISLPVLGVDFEKRLVDEEQTALMRGIVVFQVYVNLGEAWSGRAVTFLRKRGYFFGGFLPRWFGTDGFLMQKLVAMPNFDSINLYSAESRKLLDIIKEDIKNIQ